MSRRWNLLKLSAPVRGYLNEILFAAAVSQPVMCKEHPFLRHLEKKFVVRTSRSDEREIVLVWVENGAWELGSERVKAKWNERERRQAIALLGGET